MINDTDFVGQFRNVISERQYNLVEVINTVLEQNLTLQSVQKDVELSGQDVKTAKSNFLPSLTASANGNVYRSKISRNKWWGKIQNFKLLAI